MEVSLKLFLEKGYEETTVLDIVDKLGGLTRGAFCDGFIKKMNAKLLSEILILLANFWLIPSVFPCTKQEFFDKLSLTKNIFDGIGVPIFDEEIIGYCNKVIEKNGTKLKLPQGSFILIRYIHSICINLGGGYMARNKYPEKTFTRILEVSFKLFVEII